MDLILPSDEYQLFDQFGVGHLTSIGLMILAIALVIWRGDYLRSNRKTEHKIRWIIVGALLLSQVYYYLWNFIFAQDKILQNLLPVHLCSAILVPLIWYSIKPNRFLYEIYFFWGLLGGGAAVIFPYTEGFNWPHTRVIQTIFVHVVFFFLVFYFTVVDQYILTIFSVIRVYLWTIGLGILAFFANLWTGANYMFLGTSPPGTSTPLDLFPQDWTKYPLAAVVLALVYLAFFGLWKLGTLHRYSRPKLTS
jgi:hypothetical integral membrane protein (TIGR02206 family)